MKRDIQPPLGYRSSPDHTTMSFGFSYFRNEGEEGIFLLRSDDARHWKEINGGRPVLVPEVGGKLTRDPSVCRGPDGVFHMVWTSSWTDPGFGVAHSTDLLTWSAQEFVPVNGHEPAAMNTWAPEIFYDEIGKDFLVLWATTIRGRFPETADGGDMNHRIYFSRTRDFVTWTAAELYYDGGFNVIDAVLFRSGGRYGLVVKDETLRPVAQKNLRVVWSLGGSMGPWDNAGPPFTGAEQGWVEGPSVIHVGDRWLVYFDQYTQGGYAALETTDFQTFTKAEVSLPKGIRHGTVFRI